MPNHRTGMWVPCALCGTAFWKIPSTPRRFCSLACAYPGRSKPLHVRFWPKVQKTEYCWEWTAAKDHHGYGKIGGGDHRRAPLTATRAAWLLATGTLPPVDRDVGHTCDNPGCVRNDDIGVYVVNGVKLPRAGHLFLCDATGNMQDAAAKGRTNPRRGVDNPRAKLTDASVRDARRRYTAGTATARGLAVEAGVNRRVMGKALRRETWRHVD